MDWRAFIGTLAGGLLAAPLAAEAQPAAFMTSLRWLTAAALSVSLLAPTGVLAQQAAAPPLRGADLLAALRAGGYILYFRHADTDHSQSDQRTMNIEDCTTQRNLTDRGRAHARAIGEAIRALRIPIGIVVASPLCRTVAGKGFALTGERVVSSRHCKKTP